MGLTDNKVSCACPGVPVALPVPVWTAQKQTIRNKQLIKSNFKNRERYLALFGTFVILSQHTVCLVMRRSINISCHQSGIWKSHVLCKIVSLFFLKKCCIGNSINKQLRICKLHKFGKPNRAVYGKCIWKTYIVAPPVRGSCAHAWLYRQSVLSFCICFALL